MLQNITYVKDNGERSNRVVHVVTPIADTMLTIDLTQYSEEQRIELDAQIEQAHQDFLNKIKELGLNKNWRRFKQKGIIVE